MRSKSRVDVLGGFRPHKPQKGKVRREQNWIRFCERRGHFLIPRSSSSLRATTSSVLTCPRNIPTFPNLLGRHRFSCLHQNPRTGVFTNCTSGPPSALISLPPPLIPLKCERPKAFRNANVATSRRQLPSEPGYEVAVLIKYLKEGGTCDEYGTSVTRSAGGAERIVPIKIIGGRIVMSRLADVGIRILQFVPRKLPFLIFNEDFLEWKVEKKSVR